VPRGARESIAQGEQIRLARALWTGHSSTAASRTRACARAVRRMERRAESSRRSCEVLTVQLIASR